MRHSSWKCRIFIVCTVTGLLIFYIEIFSYILCSHGWTKFPSKSQSPTGSESINNEEPLRILLVADPQIQGELDELWLLGIITRWDADSFLKKTFKLAKHHVSPHVVIFLGDLFDEGFKASEDEYQRYLRRFSNIFDLPDRNDVTSKTKYIFVPGDNDVGGEREPVSELKLKWFNDSFNDYNAVTSIRQHNWGVNFLNYNKFFPKRLINPLKGKNENDFGTENTFTVLTSHFSVLKFISESVQEVVDSVGPSLILSAHLHQSNLFRFDYGTKNSLHTTVIRNFLLQKKGQKEPQSSQSQFDNLDTTTSDKQYYRFHINKTPLAQTIHEINVPTCSYRMGTSIMGYGSLQIFQDGTVDYTVLWLPSRFTQLYIYEGFYILMKIIFSPYMLWKTYTYTITKYKAYKLRKGKNYHSV